jgi:beta-phosphoglucomutase-like phosphatase (HAD superfamily)
MEHIKLIAVDIDGVLLQDTFSPVLHQLVTLYGGTYTRELERNVFSRNQQSAAHYVSQQLGLTLSPSAIIEEYFRLRDLYLQDHEGGLIPGALNFLQRMTALSVPMICYGGLEESRIHPDYALCRPYFSRYVCTNDFRPGLREIVRDHAHLDYSQVLFIDDVNTVAEEAKQLGCPFIGVPSRHEWGWQYQDMQLTGVRFLVDGVRDISPAMLQQLDLDARSSFIEVAHALL